MDRRQLVIALGSILATSSGAAWTQPVSKRRVVWFSGASKSAGGALDSLVDGLRTLGYQQNRDYVLETLWAEFSVDRARKLASELADSRPAVIVANGLAIGPAVSITPPVPVVFVMSGNPIDSGIAESFARPGRNATGVSLMVLDLTEKRMDLLKQVVPGMRRVAILANPEHAGEYRERAAAQAAADKLRLEFMYFQARNPDELKNALPVLANAKPDGLYVFGDSLMLQERRSIAEFLRQSRIPSASGWSEFAESGFLLTYGPDRRASWLRLAYFVDRILKGARPRDLPIELPTVIDLFVNRTTAKELNLVVPQSILLQATRAVD